MWQRQSIIFLFAFLVFFKIDSPARIYDCFLFFNELELLEIRLNEMYDHVDQFVLVECTETFRGTPKSLYYEENKHRFAPYASKIRHIIVTDHFASGNPWGRESFQRNQLSRGLINCQDTDTILISDLDEIVRGSDIQRLIAPILSGKTPAVCGSQAFYRLYLNRKDSQYAFWNGTVATTAGYCKKVGPQYLREHKDFFPSVQNVGWHFTCAGGAKRYIQKIESFSHVEVDTPESKDLLKLYQHIQTLELIPIDTSFPKIVQDHVKEFTTMGLIDFPGNLNYQ